MKKILSLFLTFLMVVSVVSVGTTFVNAEEQHENGFYYSIINDEATITDFDTSISGNVIIPSTLGGYPVTNIGDDAFSSCSSLTSITIPDSVTSIGDDAFENCSSLTSVTIGKSVTSIGDWAFSFCDSLKKVNINNIKSWCEIDFENSFANPLYRAKNLYLNGNLVTNLVIPDNVTKISDGAFENCSSLTSVTIGKSVTGIGCDAFSGCKKLTNITIPDSVTSIGRWAFSFCDSLEKVNINNIKSWCEIDFENPNANPLYHVNSVLSYTKNLYLNGKIVNDLVIPDSVTSIGDYAFCGCTSLTSVSIPDSVTSIGVGAFRSCDSLTSITVDKNNQNYSSVDGVLFNKNKTNLIQYPAGNTRTSYIIPSGVKIINNVAFTSCLSLTSVEIPNSVTSIGDYAFEYCRYLTRVTIGKNVTSIGDNAFYSSSSLTSITIPDSVTSIGEDAFSFCSSLTSITIGNGTTSIGERAFYNTGYYKNKSNWENGVLYIGNYLIEAKSSSSDSCIIKNGTKTIACNAFDYSNFKNITIPKSLTNIGATAFYKCSLLANISVDEDNQNYSSVDGILFNKNKTKLIQYPGNKDSDSYTVPNSVTSIDNYAFYDCLSLESITIPDSVISIGSYAFYDCFSLTSVNIGNGTTSIGNKAFYDCDDLKTVTIGNSVTSIGEDAFYGCSSNLTIYGQEGSTAESYAKENNIKFVLIDVVENPTEPSTKPTESTTKPSKPDNTQPSTKPSEKPTEPTTNPNNTQPSVKPSSCTHKVVTKNTKKATYFAKGYTGDKVCSKCGVVTIKGKDTKKLKLKTPKFSLTGGKKQFKVKYTKVADATGFEVKYKLGKGKLKVVKVTTKKSMTKIIKKLKRGSYKVQVRAVVKQGKKTAYSNWSKTQNIKVK